MAEVRWIHHHSPSFPEQTPKLVERWFSAEKKKEERQKAAHVSITRRCIEGVSGICSRMEEEGVRVSERRHPPQERDDKEGTGEREREKERVRLWASLTRVTSGRPPLSVLYNRGFYWNLTVPYINSNRHFYLLDKFPWPRETPSVLFCLSSLPLSLSDPPLARGRIIGKIWKDGSYWAIASGHTLESRIVPARRGRFMRLLTSRYFFALMYLSSGIVKGVPLLIPFTLSSFEISRILRRDVALELSNAKKKLLHRYCVNIERGVYDLSLILDSFRPMLLSYVRQVCRLNLSCKIQFSNS